VNVETAVSAGERLRVALANLRRAEFADQTYRQLEEAMASPRDAVAGPRDTLGRLGRDATEREKDALREGLEPEAGRDLFSWDTQGRFWAVGRIDVGAGARPKLGVRFPANYPETCPDVFVFAGNGGAVRLPLDLERSWEPGGGCRLVLRRASEFLRSLVARARQGGGNDG